MLSPQGEYYNQDEVQAMVTAEVLEEEKKRREENAQIEAEMAEAAAAMQSQAEKANTAKKKRRRGGPMVAAWTVCRFAASIRPSPTTMLLQQK